MKQAGEAYNDEDIISSLQSIKVLSDTVELRLEENCG